jgi:membrane protein implicated in regulation of membrane protease activity
MQIGMIASLAGNVILFTLLCWLAWRFCRECLANTDLDDANERLKDEVAELRPDAAYGKAARRQRLANLAKGSAAAQAKRAA